MRTFEDTPWGRAARIAAGQWGAITTKELRRCGCSERMVRTALETGRVFRVHHAVYAVGHPPVTPHERAMAAVLAAGDGALLSHRWALWLWELGRLPTGKVQVTARATRKGGPGYELHRSRHLPTDRNHGIPVTDPARTLSDCAPLLTTKHLRRAVNDAQIKRLVNAEQLLAYPRLRALVSSHGATRSHLEDLLRELAADGLPAPESNVIVHGVEVDFHYPELRLVIEADGYRFHYTRIAFEGASCRAVVSNGRGMSPSGGREKAPGVEEDLPLRPVRRQFSLRPHSPSFAGSRRRIGLQSSLGNESGENR